MKRLLASLLALALLCAPAAPVLADEAPSEEVLSPLEQTARARALPGVPIGEDPVGTETSAPAPASWYDAAVADVTAKGIMTGTDKGFEPQGTVTRAMVFQTLYNLEGRPAVRYPIGHLLEMNAALEGITGYWWTDAALWAYQEGMTTGTGGAGFAGDRAVTRAEIVTILYRYAQYKGVDVSIGEDTNILSYEDAENVAPWAVPAFQWAVGSATVSGKNGTLLAPTDTATRAELAQILSNYAADAPAQGAPDADVTEAAEEAVVLSGKAVKLDKYGGVQTDITAQDLAQAGIQVGDLLSVRLSSRPGELLIPYVSDSAQVDVWNDLVTVDQGVVCLSTRMGDLATAYGVGSRGDSAFSYEMRETDLTLTLAQAGGYAQDLADRGAVGTLLDSRAQAPSDEAFANFRAVAAGDIAPGVLYRSASPIDPDSPRAPYADSLLARAGVQTIVNMADCRAQAPEYAGFADRAYAKVHAEGGVVYLNMGGDMYVDVGLDDLKNGLDFITEREGPYLIHAGLGRDRAGHLALLLEALMGASREEIVADYMASYENLYGITPGSEAWRTVAAGTVEKELQGLTSLAGTDDLSAAAEKHLLDDMGLTASQVALLKERLSTPAG